MKAIKSDRDFYSKLLEITLPITFQKLMLASVAVADALMLGNIEQNAMSAVSLATQIQFIQNMVMFSIISAAGILGAQYWGKGDKKTVNDIFGISIRSCGIVSILFFVGCFFFPRYLMLIFTDEEVLIAIGIKYLRIAGWSYLLTGVSQCYLNIMKLSEHAKETAFVSSLAVVLNILFNAVLIYGLFGAPKLGVEGAAAATLIARVVELSFVIALSFRKNYIRLHIRNLFSFNKILSVDFAKCTIPLLGASLFWGVGFTSYTAFMGHLGVDTAAANSVVAVIRDLICCTCDGISNGGGILVGNELGAGKLEKGKEYGIRLAKISFVLGFLSTIVMLVLSPLVIHLVKLSEGATRLLIGMMVIMAFYMIGRASNTVIINGIFAAGGDTMFDMYSLAVTMWLIAVPLAAAGTFFFGWHPLVIYACTCLDEVGKIPWVLIHFKKYKWVRDLTKNF